MGLVEPPMAAHQREAALGTGEPAPAADKMHRRRRRPESGAVAEAAMTAAATPVAGGAGGRGRAEREKDDPFFSPLSPVLRWIWLLSWHDSSVLTVVKTG